jgi:hypothetical protein
LIRGSRHPQMSFRETHRNVIRFSHLLCQVLLRVKVRTAAHALRLTASRSPHKFLASRAGPYAKPLAGGKMG